MYYTLFIVIVCYFVASYLLYCLLFVSSYLVVLFVIDGKLCICIVSYYLLVIYCYFWLLIDMYVRYC